MAAEAEVVKECHGKIKKIEDIDVGFYVREIRDIWERIIKECRPQDAAGMLSELAELPCPPTAQEQDMLNQLQVLGTMWQTLNSAIKEQSSTSSNLDSIAFKIQSMEHDISQGISKILSNLAHEVACRLKETRAKFVLEAFEDSPSYVRMKLDAKNLQMEDLSTSVTPAQMSSVEDSVISLETLCKVLLGKGEPVLRIAGAIEQVIESANFPRGAQRESSKISDGYHHLLSGMEIVFQSLDFLREQLTMSGNIVAIPQTSRAKDSWLRTLFNDLHGNVERVLHIVEAIEQVIQSATKRVGMNTNLSIPQYITDRIVQRLESLLNQGDVKKALLLEMQCSDDAALA